MKILVACEESQAVTIEFRKLGHEAYSCDIEPCSGGHPEWHLQQDVLPLLKEKWDMIIAFPPCTYLTPAGACNIPKHPERIQKGFKAAEFFRLIYYTDCPKIAIENPPPMKRFNLPAYSQIIQPFQFGHPVSKKTALWLKGLPELQPVNIINYIPDMIIWEYKGQRKSCSRWYNTNTKNHSLHRSKTFPGIAKAMAEQWGKESYTFKNGGFMKYCEICKRYEAVYICSLCKKNVCEKCYFLGYCEDCYFDIYHICINCI